MPTTVAKLREIQARCLGDQPLTDELARWLGVSLERFLERECRTLDEALGLSFPQGGVPWWLEEAIRRRDAALRDLAALVCRDQCTATKAKRVYSLSVRYAGSAWRFDRERAVMPARYEGTARACIWRAFKSGAAMPIGERHLRTILGD